MPILRLDNISLSFGSRPLLQDLSLSIEKGERICLVGRNGEGKSSLLRVVSGKIMPDEGEVIHDRALKIAVLEQEIPQDLDGSVYEVVASGLAQTGEKLAQYHALLEFADDEATLDKISRLQQELDQLDAWNSDRRITEIITRLELDPTVKVAELSGGWIRRVLLARALVLDPELILLDEPTNHLDIEMIEWLETTLLSVYNGALLFVSHDRQFLNKIATKIIELDRGVLTQYPGNYESYQKQKAIEIYNEELENRAFDKKLAEEEVWIRQGIKARRTRNQGRVRELKAMRQSRSERINRQGVATLHHEEGKESGRRVIEVDNIAYAIPDRTLIKDFSLTIQRGERIGIVGPNGSGKSTLIKLLLGKLTPDSGHIELGTQLNIAYFDQMRDALDPDKTVIENVVEGSDFIDINGKKRHVISWLQDFMFTPERSRSPVNSLSGGERNRLLLAKLFTRPFNFLIMDEPTNDLDVETLELLEELLLNFEGTLLLISHDRHFLDNVVTSLLILEGNGTIREYIGGYSDWEITRAKEERAADAEKANNSRQNSRNESTTEQKPNNRKQDRKKLGFNETRELEQLPSTIAELEASIEALTNQVQDPDFYQQDHQLQADTLEELSQLNQRLETKYERWMELESMSE